MDFAAMLPQKASYDDGVITIIIAAYQRHDALNRALQSVYNQTYDKWQVLIIADCCPPDFIKKVDLSHQNVELINLPVRCGNQYGPNSVGIHLSNTTYTAFLNHDDIWLEDHLEIAIAELHNTRSNFFLGKAAFCHPKNQEKQIEKSNRLAFSELNRPELIWRCIQNEFVLFEPASSWVMTTQLAKEVGHWQAPDTINIQPILDWVKRAAGKSANFCFSRNITTLKFNVHQNSSIQGAIYLQDIPFENLINFYLNKPATVIRELVQEDIELAESRKLVRRGILTNPYPMTPEENDMLLAYQHFLKTGSTDGYTDQNHETGFASANTGTPFNAFDAIFRRTGEKINAFIPPAEVIRQIDNILGEKPSSTHSTITLLNRWQKRVALFISRLPFP